MATNYFWDEIEDNVVEEYDDNGNTIVHYMTEPTLYGSVLSQDRGGEFRYYHFDGLGNTTELTDEIGDLTDTRRYSAFGEVVQSTGITEFSWQWGGGAGYSLTEVNCYSIRRRFYELATARWLSRDRIVFSAHRIYELATQWMRAYGFVGNSAVHRRDPSGLWTDPYGEGIFFDATGRSCNPCFLSELFVNVRIYKDDGRVQDRLAKCKKCYDDAGRPEGNLTDIKIIGWCLVPEHKCNVGVPTRTGHTWISVLGGCARFSKGFHPKPLPVWQQLFANPLVGQPGYWGDDWDEWRTHFIKYVICDDTCKCIQDELRALSTNPPKYCLLDQSATGGPDDPLGHCTSVVVQVLLKCGFKVPYVEGTYIEPWDVTGWPSVQLEPEEKEISTP